MTTSLSTRTPGTLNPTRQQLDELDALLQRMLELPVNKLEETELSQDEIEETPPPPPPKPISLEYPARTEQDTPPLPPPPPMPIASAPVAAAPAPVAAARETRAAKSPLSYLVVETASPRPLPPASGFEPRPSVLVPVTPPKQEPIDEPPESLAPAAPALPPQEQPPSLRFPENETWVPLRSTWQPTAQTWPPLADSWHQAHNAPAPQPAPPAVQAPHLDFTPPREIMTSVPLTPAEPIPPPPSNDKPTVEPKLSLTAEDAPVAEPPLLLPLLWFNQGFDACLAPLGTAGKWLSGPRGRPLLGIVGLTCLAAAIAIAVSAGMGWTW